VTAVPAPRALAILGGDVTALAVARDAARLGIKPFVYAPRDDLVGRSRHVTLRPVDGLSHEAVLEQLASDAKVNGAGALVACSDRWLEFLLRHRAVLDQRFPRILQPANDILELCLSKRRFAEWTRDAGVPSPRMVTASEAQQMLAAGHLPFPLLLRPEFSLRFDAPPAPAKAAEARTLAELERWLAAFAAADCPVLITESLLGVPLRQYSVAVAARDGEMLSYVAEKLRPRAEQRAVGTCVEIRPHAEAERIARDMLARMAFQGVAEVEILERASTGELFVIEVNARPWSQFALANAGGRDFLRFLLNDAGAWKPATATRTRGPLWLDFTGDLYMCFSRSEGLVRRGNISFGEYARTVLGPTVSARFRLDDPGPAFYELLRFARRMLGAPSR
jgi:predicted ATP-grasp superfamily ATP-dependent carboligase